MKKVFFILLILFLLFHCKKKEIQKSITVSILPQKYFVERIVKDNFKINVLIGPGQEPHSYEPLPKQLIELSGSQLYFTIGLPFEEVLLKKIRNSNPELQIIKTQENILLREFDSYETHEDHEHKNEHGHEHENDSHNNKDPHIWLSPNLVKVQVKNIYNAIISLDPENKDYYKKNLDKFISDLEKVSDEIKKAFSNINKKEILVYHPSWGYFADEFGLKQIPIEIEGKEPTPKNLANIIKIAKQEKINVIFVQKQFSTNSAKAIAKEINGSVVTIDPLSEDYLNNLKNIADTIKKSLK